MRYRALFALTLVGAWGLSTLSCVADDAERCANAAGREGITACDRVIASGKTSSRGLASAHYNRGLSWFEAGQYDRAIADYDASIRLDPASASSFNNRGSAWYAKGDADRALADFEKAIELNPAYARAYNNRAEVFKDRGDFSRAIADYDKAIGLDRGYTAAYADRGFAYERIGDVKRAAEDYRTALALPPKYADGQLAQAMARERLAALTAVKERPAGGAARGRRIALVIGNSAYAAVRVLPNPPNDAKLVASVLRDTGFESVEVLSDLGRDRFLDALRAFEREARQADWAVIYFGGHGMEIDGMNYLIPVDARLEADSDAKFEAVSLDQVLAVLRGARKLRLVMLDACRTNPFPEGRQSADPRDISRGLKRVEPAAGTLVAYAAKDGQTAIDGRAGNSPFAEALAKNIPAPGVEVDRVFRHVRDDVMEATKGRQEPFTYGALLGREDYFFVPR